MTLLYTVIAGLIALAVYFILTTYGDRRVVAAAIVALSFTGYYYYSTKLPDLFGYAVDIKLISIEESRVISAFDGPDMIYIVVLHKGETEPRLIKMEKTERNSEQLSNIKKGLKKGAVVVKGKEGNGKPSKGEYDVDTGDLKIVPIKEQTIFEKDQP